MAATEMELLRQRHDEVLKALPGSEGHECPICLDPEISELSGGGTTVELTKAEAEELVNNRVAEATADLEKKLADEKAKAEKDAEDAAKVSGLEAQIAKLEADIDAADIAKQAAEQKATDAEAEIANIQAYLAAEAEAAEEASKLEARADERLAEIKEIASFSDERLAANRDRWAKLSDEEWEDQKADYKEIAAKAGTSEKKTEKVVAPNETVLETAQAEGDAPKSALTKVLTMHKAGFDPRQTIQG